MKSLTIPGIFTSNGFFAVLFIALSIAFYKKGRQNSGPNSGTDKRSFILSLISFIAGIIMLVFYIIQLSGVFG